VRHAEKAAEPANDPGLTAAGEARAQALVEATRAAGVSAIVTTQFARTRATAAPIAAALRITPEVIEAGGAQHTQAVAQAILTKHAGETVLVVGHSNTIPAIIAALGAPQPPQICDSEYDGLYIVTVPASGEARLIRARYGTATMREGCAPMRP
jgi:broad specificity phosphatase PhoE